MIHLVFNVQSFLNRNIIFSPRPGLCATARMLFDSAAGTFHTSPSKERIASMVTQRERPRIGEKLRSLRKYRRLTLRALSKRAGYSVSVLSKMENERLGLSYDKLARLAVALEVDMSTLFADAEPIEGPQAVGRRSVARKGSGKRISTGNYDYLYV